MASPKSAGSREVQALRKAALRHPDVEETVACQGTSVESASFKVKGKAFLFLRAGTAMVKLDKSRAEAARLAAKAPDRCKAGAQGWTTITLGGDSAVPPELLKRWIDESYALMAAPKGLRRSATK